MTNWFELAKTILCQQPTNNNKMKVKLIHTAYVEISEEAFKRLQDGDEPDMPLIDLIRESDIGKTEVVDATKEKNPVEDTWDDSYLCFDDPPEDDDAGPDND